MTGLIDTHHHFLPKVYVDAVGMDDLAKVMPDRKPPNWSPSASLALMDEFGIEKSILSMGWLAALDDPAPLYRQCNEAAAELVRDHPGRFGSFACLPLPDVDAALKEVAYSLDILAADGFVVFTNYAGRYLGDQNFWPLWEELDRRGTTVFIHPSKPPYALQGQPPESVLEFLFETTRTAASLVGAGVLRRCPNIRFILSHAGGTLPYVAARLAGGLRMAPGTEERIGDPLLAFRQFWFDIALSMNETQITALLSIADPSHLTFGTDYPMAPRFFLEANVRTFNEMAIDETLRRQISRDNARSLLGRA